MTHQKHPIRQGQDFAEQVAEVAAQADEVVVAQFSEAEYPSILQAGYATVPFDEYRQRVAGLIARLEQSGITVSTTSISTAEITEALAEHQLPHNPDGCAAAIALIHRARQSRIENDE